MDCGRSLRWARRQWREADLSPPSGVRLRMPKLCTHFPAIYPDDLHTASYFTLTNILYCTSTIRDKLFFLARQPLLGLLISEIFFRSHSDTSHSVGLLWTSDRPVAKTSTSQHKITHNKLTSMFPTIFEPATPATQMPQTCVDQNLHDNTIRTLLNIYCVH